MIWGMCTRQIKLARRLMTESLNFDDKNEFVVKYRDYFNSFF